MLLICPTSQANCLRRINATGKSLGVREIVSSEQQVLSRPGCGAARSAAPLSRDPFLQDGPRISNAPLKRCAASGARSHHSGCEYNERRHRCTSCTSTGTALLPGYEGFFGFCGWMVSPAASIVTNFSILAARVSGFLALCTR